MSDLAQEILELADQVKESSDARHNADWVVQARDALLPLRKEGGRVRKWLVVPREAVVPEVASAEAERIQGALRAVIASLEGAAGLNWGRQLTAALNEITSDLGEAQRRFEELASQSGSARLRELEEAGILVIYWGTEQDRKQCSAATADLRRVYQQLPDVDPALLQSLHGKASDVAKRARALLYDLPESLRGFYEQLLSERSIPLDQISTGVLQDIRDSPFARWLQVSLRPADE